MKLLGKKRKKLLITVAVIFSVLIVIRVTAPYGVEWYVNRLIDKSPAISGSIGDVDLALIRGAYSVKAVNIRQTGDDSSFPFIKIDRVESSILWSALFRGRLVSEIEFYNPQISLYSRPKDKIIESDTLLEKKTWVGFTESVLPFRLDRVSIENGKFLFDAKDQSKASQLTIGSINGVATNIANSDTSRGYAEVDLKGKIQDQALLTVKSTVDPTTEKPTFDLNLQMEKLPVSFLDALIKFYAPFDLEAGEIDLVTELKAENGSIDGYVKTGVYDVEVFSWHEDVVEDNDNPFEIVVEGVTAMFSTLVESTPKDLIATRIPIEGQLDDPELSATDAFLGILRNAFIKAYELRIEDSVDGLSDKGLAEQDDSESPQ